MKASKTLSFLFLLSGIFFFSSNAKAGCTGVCIGIDSTDTETTLHLYATDTVYASNGVRIFSHYNGSCYTLMQSNNVQLVWFRNGLPYDTTDNSDARYDGIWTYTTGITVTQPGLYQVYFSNFIQPGYECRSVLVMAGSDPAVTGISSFDFAGDQFTIFPNPASGGQFSIQSEKGTHFTSIHAYNAQGKEMTVYGIRTGENTSDYILLNAEAGMYLVSFTTEAGMTVTKKIFVGNTF